MTREGKVPDKGREQKKTADRAEKNRSGQNRAVSRREQVIAGTYELRGRVGQCETSQRSWWLWGNFVQIHTHTSLQMHWKLCISVTNFFLLVLGANPSPCLFVCLFVLLSSTLSVVYVVFYVSVKKCEIPLARDERNH